MNTCAIIVDNKQYILVNLLQQTEKYSYVIGNDKKEKKINNERLIWIFKSDNLVALIENINKLKTTIDIELLWELSNTHNELDELTEIYFNNALLVNKLSVFFAITEDQIYFTHQKKIEFLRASKADIEKKQLKILKEQEELNLLNLLVENLRNGIKPDIFDDNLITVLNDKGTKEKALDTVAKELKVSKLELLEMIGYSINIEEIILYKFNKQRKQSHTVNTAHNSLPINNRVKAFSIDDKATTEIDDAFSVEIGDMLKIGIHISAPALNTSLLDIAVENISSLYYPGGKITMLDSQSIQEYSLIAPKIYPVVSIYFNIDNEYNILNYESVLEYVTVVANLRIESLENILNEPLQAFHEEINILEKIAKILTNKRGRSSNNNTAIEYGFSKENGVIKFIPRDRNHPIDKIVSELMILANSSWGEFLTHNLIPTLYRVKQPNQPVVTTTTPESHIGLNLKYYIWASSPLRRAVDMINQYQLICLLQNMPALKSTDRVFISLIDRFDEKYQECMACQDKLERYWALMYLLQEKTDVINTKIVYKNTIQLEGVPYFIQDKSITTDNTMIQITKIDIYNLSIDYLVHFVNSSSEA